MNLNGCFYFLLVFLLLSTPAFGLCQHAESDTSDISFSGFKDNWFGEDKAQHTVVSFILVWWGTMIHESAHQHGLNQDIRAGIGFSFTLGLAKEIHDSRKDGNRFSLKDLAADILGIGMAVLVINRLRHAG